MMVTSFPTKITKDEPGGLKYFLCLFNKSEILFYIFSTIRYQIWLQDTYYFRKTQ